MYKAKRWIPIHVSEAVKISDTHSPACPVRLEIRHNWTCKMKNEGTTKLKLSNPLLNNTANQLVNSFSSSQLFVAAIGDGNRHSSADNSKSSISILLLPAVKPCWHGTKLKWRSFTLVDPRNHIHILPLIISWELGHFLKYIILTTTRVFIVLATALSICLTAASNHAS